jgi:predicted RND superfamily exporter protein
MMHRLFVTWSQWVLRHRMLAVTALVLFTLGCMVLSTRSRVDNSLSVWQSELDPHWQHYQQFQEDNQISDPLVIYFPSLSRQEYTALRDQLGQACECSVSGFFIAGSPGSDKAILLLKPPPDSPPDVLDGLVTLTRSMLDQSGKTYHLGGVWYVTAMLDSYSARSVSLLFPVVVAVLWLGIWCFLRHTGNVMLVMACGLIPAMQIIGLLALWQIKLNMVLLALPPMTMILGTAYAIHLAAKKADQEQMARHRLFASTATPCLLAAMTTVLGFLSLTISAYNPVCQLGIWGSVATALALINTLILLPAFYRSDHPGASIRLSFLNAAFLQRRRLTLLVVFAVALVAAVFGLHRLKTGSLILDFFYPSAEVHKNYVAIESAGLGLTPFEIDLKESHLDTVDLNQALLAWAKQQSVITHFIYFFPEGQVVVQATDQGLPLPSPSDLQYVTSPATRATVLLRTVSSEKTLELAEALNNYLINTFGPLPHPYVTGSVPLYTRGQSALFSSMAKSFSFAFISVSLIIGISLRSWRYGLIAILPNILPVVFILAAMGWIGTPLSVSTITVASIVFGIVVDDTIHFLHSLRTIDGNLGERLQLSLEHVGPAIIITSVVSGIGFAGFAASPFIPLRDFGLIISGALLLALLCDLLLLPAILFTWRS